MHVIAKQSIVLKHNLESDRRQLVSLQVHHFTIAMAQTVKRAKKTPGSRNPSKGQLQMSTAGCSASSAIPGWCSEFHVATCIAWQTCCTFFALLAFELFERVTKDSVANWYKARLQLGPKHQLCEV